jgi:hypothetical protein
MTQPQRTPRKVEAWTVKRLQTSRPQITFPEYQRQPNLWPIEKKRLLIDSILNDIDIPKLYFNVTPSKEVEVVDGQQRLWTVWEFVDDGFELGGDGHATTFSGLTPTQRDSIWDYEFQVTVFKDAPEDYLRTLFVRLQLGLLLVAGEKLNALSGAMREFVFGPLTAHQFMKAVNVPTRRFAKQTLAAQMAINTFTRAKVGEFARTRFDDLQYFFKEYEHPQQKEDKDFFKAQSRSMTAVLDTLNTMFDKRAADLANRSYILSLYLFVAEVTLTAENRRRFVTFAFLLQRRLKEEAKRGMDRTNKELYTFQTMLSSAPGERYQIERRHQKLTELFAHYQSTGKLKGD